MSERSEGWIVDGSCDVNRVRIFPGFLAMRGSKPATYSRAWRRKQVWWRRSGRGSGASRRRRTQRGPSASSQAVGEPRRPAEILVPPIAPAGTLSRPWNTQRSKKIIFHLIKKFSDTPDIFVQNFKTREYFLAQLSKIK